VLQPAQQSRLRTTWNLDHVEEAWMQVNLRTDTHIALFSCSQLQLALGTPAHATSSPPDEREPWPKVRPSRLQKSPVVSTLHHSILGSQLAP
jgi:hypothetical protein